MSLLRTPIDEMTTAPTLRGRPDDVQRGARPGVRKLAELPAVVLIGGEANALSIARELGRQGVKVFAISPEETCVRRSRYCEWITLPPSAAPQEENDDVAERRLLRFLFSPDADRLGNRPLLIACSDAALKMMAEHRAMLLTRFSLDLAHPPAQLAMLDKLRTYEIARAAGVPTPKFWAVDRRDQIDAIRDELVFPLMIKPRLSHVFEARFGRKHIIVAAFEELAAVFDSVADQDVDVMLVEVIPGGDDRLSSYFTYVDEHGQPLCHFTKRVIRRYPAGMGAACYHVTGDVPEIIEPSLRLIRAAGVRGLANVEFKHDPRDGRPRLIECNLRFVASNALVAASGLRFATFIHQRAAGRNPQPPAAPSPAGRPLRLWDPVRDFAAFLELRRAGRITLRQWVVSVARRRMLLPYFAWSDPGPTLARLHKASRRARARPSV